MNGWFIITIAAAALGAGFAGVFFICRRIDNYGFIDVAWSYAFAALSALFGATGSGWIVRRLLLAAMVAIWSVRLGTHLLRRIASHHPAEDSRYAQLRRKWAANFTPKMFGFFQLQAVSVVLLGLVFLSPTRNAVPRVHTAEWLGIALWLVSIAGETVADIQLATFKGDAAKRGRVCNIGLWRYSRHPNYFFEWLIWLSYGLFALASPFGWMGLFSPLAILFLLLRVTGIPQAEQQSLLSKGDAYRRYQQTTSAFVPMPNRNART